MAYPVDNIIPVNILITPAGIGYANFSTAFIIARQADLEGGVTFDVDTYRDYASLDEVGEDFSTTSDTYKIATRWFANIPKPLQISVWMWDEVTDTDVIDTLEKANDAAWRYFYFLPHDVYSVEATMVVAVGVA